MNISIEKTIELLARFKGGGCQCKVKPSKLGGSLRGEIKSITVEKDSVVVILNWAGHKCGQTWTKNGLRRVAINLR